MSKTGGSSSTVYASGTSVSTKARAIGCLGDIPFQVSAKQVQTFNDLTWTSSAKYSGHALHLKTEQLELTGFSADQVTFSMELSAFLGVKPDKMLTKLQKMLAKGSVVPLIIGRTVIGPRYVVTDLSRSYNRVFMDGRLLSCEVKITVKEYKT